MAPRLSTAKEIALILDASYNDVMSWARTGQIPAIRHGGRYYFRVDKVLAALARHEDGTRPVTAEAAAL